MSKKTILKLIILFLFASIFFVSPKGAKAAIVNSTINTDQLSSITPFAMVGSDNYARLVYYTTTSQLVYVQCKEQACTNSSRTVLNTGAGAILNGNVAAYKENVNTIQIFYVNYDANNYIIRQITCTLAAVDSCASAVGRYTIASATPNPIIGFNQFTASRDSSNRPRLLLSWNDNGDVTKTQRLDIFNCTTNTCTTPGRQTLLSTTTVGTTWKSLSMTLSSGNFALLTYWEVTSSSAATLRFFQCNATTCTSATKPASSPTILDTLSVASLAVGLTSITTTSGDFPAITYSWKPTTPPNTKVAICTNIACSSGTNFYSTLTNDSNTKIIRLPAGYATCPNCLRIFSTRNLVSTSLKMIQCNPTCNNVPWPAEVNVESNNANWSSAFVGSDGSPRVVYNSNPGGAGIVLRMGCDLEGGSACPASFSLSVTPAINSTQQGSSVTYTVIVTPFNGFTGTVNGFTVNWNAPIPTGVAVSSSPASLNFSSASSAPQSFTVTLTTTAPPTAGFTQISSAYSFTVGATSNAVTRSSSAVALWVLPTAPKPWVKVTGGDVGSKQTPINMFTGPPKTAETIIGVRVTNGGLGYTANAGVTFSGGGGINAAATAIRRTSTNQIVDVRMSNSGSGYNSIPTLTIAAPACAPNPLTCATATGVAILAGNNNYATLVGGVSSTITNFTSAKSWLISAYPNTVDDQMGGSDYYSYFWNNFGAGRAANFPPNPATDCSTITYGFYFTTNPSDLVSPSCVLTTTYTGGVTPKTVPMFPDNGVFVYNGDLTYNIDAPYNTDIPNGNNRGGLSVKPYAGADFPLINRYGSADSPGWGPAGIWTGNPTVYFVKGNLRFNKPLITQGNKKVIFIVSGKVEINAWTNRIDAYIISNGTFNSAIWLNPRNQARWATMLQIEAQLALYKAGTGGYPTAENPEYDTSDGCNQYGKQGTGGWWFEPGGMNPVGGRNWDGSTPAASPTANVNFPCSTTQGLRYKLNQTVGSYAPGGFNLNNYLDPSNGLIDLPAFGGAPKKIGCTTGINVPAGCRMLKPKKFAFRYTHQWAEGAAQPSLYTLFATMEDDGNIDPYADVPDPSEIHNCGGNYNADTSVLYNGAGENAQRKWKAGGYCHFNELVVNGGVVTQGGFILQRDLRDDNNSSFDNVFAVGGKGNPHVPTPGEQFNLDPSIYYYFAQLNGGYPLFAEFKSTTREDRP